MAHTAEIDDLIALAKDITNKLTDYKHATSRKSRSGRSQLEPRVRPAAKDTTNYSEHQDNDLPEIIKELQALAQKAQYIVNEAKGVTDVNETRQDDTSRDDTTRDDTTYAETTRDDTTRDDATYDDTTRDDATCDKTTRDDATRETTRDDATCDDATCDATTRNDTTRNDNVHRHSLRFPCTRRDMGENMVSTILRARNELAAQDVDERGYLVLKLDTSWDSEELVEIIRKSHMPYDNSNIVKGFRLDRDSPGVVNATVDGDAKLELSEFEGFQIPNAIEPKVAFQNLMEDSYDQVSYLITEPLGDHWVNTLLHAGSRCNQRPRMLGVNSVYWYVSCNKNTPAPLHREDGNTGSANLLLAGAEKQWLFIHKSSSERLESCVREEFPGTRDCAQFIRHLNIILETSWFDERGISYDIVHQQPGDVVVTFEGLLYHEVINSGSNFAIAINWEQPSAPNDPICYKWCQKGARKCGQNVLHRENFLVPDVGHGHMDKDTRKPIQSRKRKASHVYGANVKKSRTCSNKPLAAQYLSSVGTSMPQRIRQLLFSRDALVNCISLIKAWRSQSSTTARTSTQTCPIEKIAASDEIVRANSSRCEVDLVQLRLALYNLALAVEGARQGALRLTAEQHNEILKKQGFSNPTESDRDRLKKRMRRAIVWYEMCRISGPGLLCLLPPHCIPETSYTSMTKSDLDEFQSIVSAQTTELKERCKIGASIQNMFSIDCEFEFEYQGLFPDSETPEEDLIRLLQPVVYPSKNMYTPSHPWPKPASWIWEWPQDPTWAPEGPCTDCSTSACVCFADLPQDRHRVLDYGAKGRGVHARGASSNELAFHKGDYIQEVVGEIKPSNFESDDYMAIDVYRPDIGSVACRLYCGQRNGNWTRLINHCCDPCAEFAVVVRAGRARIMLRALQDIPDGKEITISYGDRLVMDKACLCEICHRLAV